MRSLKDKVALVIGGNSGLGKASALALAEAGAKVMVGARREAESIAVVEEIRAAGGIAEWKRVDVTVEADLEAIVAATVERFGRLDCAVNSAGYNEDFALVVDTDGAMFDRMMAVNVKGTLLGMKHQIRQMVKQGGGAIVNMASFLSHVASPTAPIYNATKAAVLSISKVAALGHVKQGVRVNCVAPAMIAGTPMVDEAIKAFPALMQPYIDEIPMGRPGRPEEVGRAVAWLCSDDASFITGHSLVIDGGQTAK